MTKMRIESGEASRGEERVEFSEIGMEVVKVEKTQILGEKKSFLLWSS